MSSRNTVRVGRTATPSAMRSADKGAKGVALVNRLGFVHGLTGQCPMDEREVFAWTLERLDMAPRSPTAHNLAVSGEAYAIGRLLGVEMSRDYLDMAPDRRAKLATTLWPASTILPRAMEPRLRAVLASFKRQADDLTFEAPVPADGSGPVAQWW